MGERKHTKGRFRRATKKASRPCEFRNGKVIRQRRGKPPASARYAAPAPVPPGFSAGVPGAKPPAK